MARTFKDKLPKYSKKDEGYEGKNAVLEKKKALKRELDRADRRALKREGLVEE